MVRLPRPIKGHASGGGVILAVALRELGRGRLRADGVLECHGRIDDQGRATAHPGAEALPGADTGS